MTATVNVSINADGWTELASGSSSVSVQRRTAVPVLVRAEIGPPSNSDFTGVMLAENYDSASFSGLSGSDKVYGRCATTPPVGETPAVIVVRS